MKSPKPINTEHTCSIVDGRLLCDCGAEVKRMVDYVLAGYTVAVEDGRVAASFNAIAWDSSVGEFYVCQNNHECAGPSGDEINWT